MMRQIFRVLPLFGLAAGLLAGVGLLTAQQPMTTPEPQPVIQATPTVERLAPTTAATPTFTPAATTAATPTTALTPAGDQTYIVVRGDRLIKIAERYGVTAACLTRVNRIVNPNLIYIGQTLLIPANCDQGGGEIPTPTRAAAAAAVTGEGITGSGLCQFDRYPARVAPGGVYTIRAGDTLDYIACDFGIALTCLVETNPQLGTNRGRIRAGDTVSISLACPAWEGAVIP